MVINTFLSFSGGIDSTYYLWKWVCENKESKLLLHHCVLEQRKEEERKACQDIVKYIEEKNIFNFEYIETTFLLGNVRKVLSDLEILGIINGLILKSDNYSGVKTILGSYCLEESPNVTNILNGEIDLKLLPDAFNFRTKTYIDHIENISKKNFNYIAPHIYKSKREIIYDIPYELLKMTWFCRRPQRGKVCGNCHACKLTLPIIEEYENNMLT